MILKRLAFGLALLATSSLMTVTAQSQPTKVDYNYERTMTLGFVASPSISWLSNDDKNITSDGTMVGFKFGLSGDFFFTPSYAFSTGLYLNTVGGNLNYADSTSFEIGGESTELLPGEQMQYKVTYIEIPLSLKLQTPDFNRFIYFGRFGFTPGIRTRARNQDNLNLSEEVALFNMNYHIGGGFEYLLSGNTGITFSVVYNNGFIDVTKNRSGRNDHTTLNNVEFLVGINF